jgi:Hypothetical glycosyl hydrolase family 15
MSRSARSLLVASIFAVLCACAQPAFAESAQAGKVRFVKRTEPSFNRFMDSPTPEFEAWMNQNFWRAEVFNPYFDNKTRWYPHGWVYKDLYAVYKGGGFAAEHENWILRDAAGRPLYIPWGCSAGTCPQYAADVGNSGFRKAWIAEAKAAVEHGYIGVWIDDVNLDFRIGNGAGEEVAPVDPRTGAPMTETAWRGYVTTFLEEIRSALPGVELVHNAIWYAGGPERWSDEFVRREIAAADYVNLERGVNDEGLTGGTGPWSLKTFLAYIDYVHSVGRGVILDGWDNSASGREYSLASYFLVSTGDDGLGNGAMTPENWWPAYNYELGTPSGPRSMWEGLLRRDYSGGIALANEPGAPTRTVTLPARMYTTDGSIVTTVTLKGASGAVLRWVGPEGSSPPPGGGEGSTHENGEPRGLPILVLHERPVDHERAVVLSGTVSTTGGGQVALGLQKLVGRRWVPVARVPTRVHHAGRFRRTMRRLHPGRYRVRATYLARRHGRSTSASVRFALRPSASTRARR